MKFEQQELITALERSTRISKFFTNFFPIRKTNLAEKLEVHVKKGKKKMAPFVAPRVGGKVVTRDGFETFTVTTPKLAPMRPMTIDDISSRIFGENIYSQKTPQQRALELFATDLTDLEDSIANRIEWMARNIILGDPIVVQDVDAGVDISVDFGFTNKETLVSGLKWTTSTSNPIADLTRWRKNVIKKSGVSPNICLMGEKAYDAFLENAKVKEKLNILNMSLGEIKPTVVDKALTFQGKIVGLEIYTYDEWFLDDDGDDTAMLPVDTVILLHDNIGSIQFGGVTIIDENDDFMYYESELVPVVNVNKKDSVKELTVISRPLPTPEDVDSWFVAKVVD